MKKQNQDVRSYDRQRNLLLLLVVGLLFCILLLFIIYASSVASLSDELGNLIGTIWGQVTLVDLYIGLILSTIWVYYREKYPVVAIIWAIVFFLTGFLSVSLYIIIQLIFLLVHQNPARFFMGYRTPETYR